MLRVSDLVSSTSTGHHGRHMELRNDAEADDTYSDDVLGDEIDSTTEPVAGPSDRYGHMAPPPTPGAMVVSSTTSVPSVLSQHDEGDDNSIYIDREGIDSTTEASGHHHVAFQTTRSDMSYHQADHLIEPYYDNSTNHLSNMQSVHQPLQLYLPHHQPSEAYQSYVSHVPHHSHQLFSHNVDLSSGHRSISDLQDQYPYAQLRPEDIEIQASAVSGHRVHEDGLRRSALDRHSVQDMVDSELSSG
ncbi:hypothetical protein HDE_11040 [Halotydeus destructor]|nr:hypothetical protein HDE_11040 [Halotydeus destructor]